MQETQETQVQFLSQEDPLEEEMATHSSILARKIPWTEEPGGLQSMGCKDSDTTERLSTHTVLIHFPILKFRHSYRLRWSSLVHLFVLRAAVGGVDWQEGSRRLSSQTAVGRLREESVG